MKAGTEYELFVKEVYEAILRYEGVDNINVQHDVKILGSSGVERQVDVYWEFKTAGVKYRLIIECKDYRTAVPLEKIDAFNSKVKDIGGAIGVFVSKNGYQSGAVELARKYGIQLREIRVPTDKDWEGYIRDVEIQLHYLFIKNVHPTFNVDKEWAVANNYCETGFSEWTDKVFIENNDDGSYMSMHTMINRLSRDVVGKGIKKEFSYNDAYAHIGSDKVKINKLTFDYDVMESTDVLKICGDKLIKAIVHDVLEDETTSVHITGEVIKR